VKQNGSQCGCNDGGCRSTGHFDRRVFVQTISAAAGLAAWQSASNAFAGPFDADDTIDHFVPADKKLSINWVRMLFDRGDRSWYSGIDLETIGMPIGGICAGQLYLTGDGRLVYWDIFNDTLNTGGIVNYRAGRKPTEIVTTGDKIVIAPDVNQGVMLQATKGGQTTTRTLDAQGFSDIHFCGEYPVAEIEYKDAALPVEVKLTAFSPFIPLNAVDSALPATTLNYRIRNTTTEVVDVTLAGWLQNAVLIDSAEQFVDQAVRRNHVIRESGFAAVVSGASAIEPKSEGRPPIVFANFENDDYGRWTVEGDAFGTGPVGGALENQQPVTGFQGESFVNSYLGGNDERQGRLVSPSFKIERPWIAFLIGGGAVPEKTCVNLLVDGTVVRTATGKGRESLEPHNWNVKDLMRREAKIEIVDQESAAWGHVNVDHIEFRDQPVSDNILPLRRRPDFGTMALAVLGDERTFAHASLLSAEPKHLFSLPSSSHAAEKPLDELLQGAIGKRINLGPGEEATVTFIVSWHMPNRYRDDVWVGNYYAKRYRSAADVARYVARDFDRLRDEIRLWHETYYDSTLPRWFLDRVAATLCNLATGTCQWWRNGRFWAWEGVGCCHGTCGHVWNYSHAMARLFPELERSVRTMQDFAPGVGFDSQSGAIGFRGEGWTMWAGDAQGGYVLKSYREHQCSADDEFLNTNWRNVRKSVEFLIGQDENADGLIEGRQHQTYDQDYFGANTFVGSLYLGALRAAEEMAREVGDMTFAQRCHQVFEAGRDNSVKRLFNGEYFIQTVDLAEHPEWQYGDGCLADQMFGQSWAHQVSLGYLYPQATVLKSLTSIWKYCWAPDIGAQTQHHAPDRWYAFPGEGGLFICTWPKSKHPGATSTRYRDEAWTGIEYQVASHMAWEGMLTECLAICRAVHQRYHPAKRNPFNEIECGDHYARAMASWGVLTSLTGFEYHGPRGHIGFAPRITPESFKAPFTAAEGWGSYSQKISENSVSATIALKWGRLRMRSLCLQLPDDAQLTATLVKLNESTLPAVPEIAGQAVRLEFGAEVLLDNSAPLEIELQYS
jgi:non-lysosomal glucosylceramidase